MFCAENTWDMNMKLNCRDALPSRVKLCFLTALSVALRAPLGRQARRCQCETSGKGSTKKGQHSAVPALLRDAGKCFACRCYYISKF